MATHIVCNEDYRAGFKITVAPVVKKSVDNVKEKKHGEDLMTVIGYDIMLSGVAPDDMEEEARLEALVEKKYKERYGSDATPGKQQVCINGRTPYCQSLRKERPRPDRRSHRGGLLKKNTTTFLIGRGTPTKANQMPTSLELGTIMDPSWGTGRHRTLPQNWGEDEE